MTFALIALTALSITGLVKVWSALEIRRRRWRLFEIRDRLRAYAIEDVAFRRKESFLDTDVVLTTLCRNVDAVSIRALASAMSSTAKEDCVADEDARLRDIHIDALKEVLRVLVWRHLGLMVPVAATVVGLVAIAVLAQRLKAELAARPPTIALLRGSMRQHVTT